MPDYADEYIKSLEEKHGMGGKNTPIPTPETASVVAAPPAVAATPAEPPGAAVVTQPPQDTASAYIKGLEEKYGIGVPKAAPTPGIASLPQAIAPAIPPAAATQVVPPELPAPAPESAPAVPPVAAAPVPPVETPPVPPLAPPAEVPPPAPVPGEESLAGRAFKELGRFAATANKPVMDVVHGFARGLENVLALPYRAASGDWESATPHNLTAITGKARELAAPQALMDEAHPVTKFMGNLLGGLESYMIPGKALGAAGVVLPNATLMQKFGSNLITFGATDVYSAVGAGGSDSDVRNALLKSIPTAALFTVAQVLPFDKLTNNPWMTKALESTATGGAFVGSHLIGGGETDPAALAVSFLTGFALHAVTSGVPRPQKGFTPEQMKDFWDKHFEDYKVDWQKENGVTPEQFAAGVKPILDDVGKISPEGGAAPIPGTEPPVGGPFNRTGLDAMMGIRPGLEPGAEAAPAAPVEPKPGPLPPAPPVAEAPPEVAAAPPSPVIPPPVPEVTGFEVTKTRKGWSALGMNFEDEATARDFAAKAAAADAAGAPPPDTKPVVRPDAPMGATQDNVAPEPKAPPSKAIPGIKEIPVEAKAGPKVKLPTEMSPEEIAGMTDAEVDAYIAKLDAAGVDPNTYSMKETPAAPPMGVAGGEAERVGEKPLSNRDRFMALRQEALAKVPGAAVVEPGALSAPAPPIASPENVQQAGLGEVAQEGQAGREPLRFDNQTGRYNGEKLERGDILTDQEGNRYQLDRQTGFTLQVDQLNEKGQPRGSRSFSVEPTDKTRYRDLFRTGENAYSEEPWYKEDHAQAPVEAAAPVTDFEAIRAFQNKYGHAGVVGPPEGQLTGGERMIPGETPSPDTPGISYHEAFPRDQIGLNPDVWQHKMAETGAGQALAHVKNKSEWDAEAGRGLSLYRYPDGHVELMDGHSRTTAGDRVGVPHYGVRIYDGNVYSVEAARATAALTNIRLGTGTVVDSAKAMRDFGLTPESLREKGIDLNGEHTRIALGLANLSDEVFALVARGDFPAKKGAIIGEQLPGNFEAQNAIYKLIQKKHTDKNGVISISDEKLKNDIRFAEFSKVMPTNQPVLGDVFEESMRENLVSENSELMTFAARKLSTEKNLFKTVTTKSAQLVAAGNQLKPEANKKISDDAAMGLAILDKAPFIPGTETNRLFKEFAVRLAETSNKTPIKEEFYAKLPQALEADRDAAGLGTGAGRGIRQEVPATPPGTPAEEGAPPGEPSETPLLSLKDIPPTERLAAFQESPFWKDLSVVDKAKLMFGVKEVVPNIALSEFYRDMNAPGMGSSFTKTGKEAKALHPAGYLDRIQFALKEDGTLGLASGDRPLSKFEKRLNGITSAYPNADPERVAQALRAAPKATDRELAGAASRSQEEASGMARSVTEGQRRAILAKQSGMKGAALFPEMGMGGGGGTLFDQAPEPSRVPAGARPAEAAPVSAPQINEAGEVTNLEYIKNKVDRLDWKPQIQPGHGIRPDYYVINRGGNNIQITEDIYRQLTKEAANAQEAGRGGPADVTAGERENRPGGLSENAQGNGRALARFQSRGDQETHGNRQEVEVRAGLEPASDAFVDSLEAQAIRDMVAPHEGIRNEVVFVKDSPFYDAALVPEGDGVHTLVVSETVSRGTPEQQARHEVSHAKEKAGDPETLRLVDSVDMASDAAKSYRDALNRLRAEADFPPLNDKDMASEIAADMEAGLTRRDGDGQQINLAEAVREAQAEAQAATETPAPLEKVMGGKMVVRPPTRGDKVLVKDRYAGEVVGLRPGGKVLVKFTGGRVDEYTLRQTVVTGAVDGSDVVTIGSKVINKATGETGVVRDVRPLEEKHRGYHGGAENILEVRWNGKNARTDGNVRDLDITTKAAQAVEAEAIAAQDEFRHLRTAPADEASAKVGGRTLKQETLFSGKEGEDNILDLLRVRLDVSKGKLSEDQYNSRYAEKFGEWGSQEFRDNVEFLKYSLKEPLPETDKDYSMFSEKLQRIMVERKAWADENIRLAGENPSGVRLQSTLDPNKQILIHRSTDPDYKGKWQITSLDKWGDEFYGNTAKQRGIPSDAEGRAPSGHTIANTLEDAIREASSGNNYKVINTSKTVEGVKFSAKEDEKRQGVLAPGEPVPSFKEFEADLAKDDNAREKELRNPANSLIPLYEGETYMGTRHGDFIYNADGEKIKLTTKDIYERLYNPKTATLPLGTETAKPEKLLGTPEAPGPTGTIEKPPGVGGSVLRALRNEFAAATNSEKARLTKQAITAQTSWARREMAKAMDILDTHYDRFAKMTQEDMQGFTDTVEKNTLPELRTMAENGQFEPGLLQAAEEWRRLADGVHLLRANLAEQAAENTKKSGQPAAEVQTAYWEQYFPRMFEQPPEGAGVVISQYMQGKSLTGPEGFKNARSQLLFSDSIKPKLDTIRNEDGTFSVEKTDLYKGTKEIVETFPDKAAADAMVDEKGGIGLKPLDPNYVNMMKANLFEQFRFVAGKYIQNDLIEGGLISRKPEPGHVGFEGDKTLEGYYAHPDVVQVMDNFLSKGIAKNILYKIYNTPTTFMNGVFVGFSFFHVTFSSITSMAMGIGQNVGRAIGAAATGNFGVAGHYLAETARTLNLPAQFMLGGKGSEVYKNPDSPFRKTLVGEFELGELIDHLTLGGMENQVVPFKQMLRKLIEPKQAELTQMSRSFSESIQENLGWPRKIAEAVAWPTMGQVVGRLKLAGMLRTLSMEMSDAKRAGALADFDITRAAQEIGKKYDNTMGQMVQDNLSMKQIHKNILRLWIGFPGWNIGSFTDILQLGKGIYHTGKNVMGGAKDIAMGRKPTWDKMSRSERMSMEFYGGTVLVMAVFGALAQKLFTGEWPSTENGMAAFGKDLMMPQTGELMSNGQPERLRLPTYMRDILSLNHPVEMAKHKANWPIRMFTAMVDNQDFFGTQIRDPYASVGTQIGQEAKYVGKSLLPFGVQGYLATDAPKARALNLIGITKVPRLYSNTDAMNVIDEYNKQNRATVTSIEAEAEKNLKGELRKLAKAQDEDGFKEAAQTAMEAGTLTRQQVKAIVDESQAPPGLGRFVALPVEWQVRAMAKATDAEKEAWQPYFIKKVMSAKPEILIRNRDILDPTLREMGLDDAADAIQNLKISDKAGTFKLAGLGVRQPAGEMGDIDTVDIEAAKRIAANEAKLGAEKKAAKAKKSKYSFLGIQ